MAIFAGHVRSQNIHCRFVGGLVLKKKKFWCSLSDSYHRPKIVIRLSKYNQVISFSCVDFECFFAIWTGNFFADLIEKGGIKHHMSITSWALIWSFQLCLGCVNLFPMKLFLPG